MKGFFEQLGPKTKVKHGDVTFDLPILYFRDDFFALFYSADFQRVKMLMPSEQLHPVLISKTKAVVGICAFNYMATSIDSYGEVAVVIPAVYGQKSPLLIMPLLLEAYYKGFGNLVLHLPVTTKQARDAGRGEWGYTKFIADMHFTYTPEYLTCRMFEKKEHILTLKVCKRGIKLKDKKPLITYSVKNGSLIKTTIPQRGIHRSSLMPWGSSIQLGKHPVSESIGNLGLSPRPLMSRYYLERSAILPAGTVIEDEVKSLDGYFGTNRKGKHTVAYSEEDEGS
ncbi:acetoacetate decarboxylase family protein [candidate division CSSED10-310 bacterium]|uniref:Acetoacetate decarboxylase family protein n=1 Tax=candidate division CSSED10-310 bacterium TaxID=2855610 RepID=A0ABV6YSY2_UNCC1